MNDSDATTNVEVENLGSVQALVPIVGALYQAAGSGGAVHIDLSPLDRGAAAQRRLDATTVAIFANALVGEFTRVPLVVTMPNSAGIVVQLERDGFYFALANRVGKPIFRGGTPKGLTAWAEPWQPRSTLLEPDLAPAGLAERTWIYINPHRLGRGHFRQYPEGASIPWLGQLIPSPRPHASKERRDRFVLLAERAIVEILENDAEHAFDSKGAIANRRDWLRPPEKDGRSFLLCALTRGGAKSWDRLRLLAFDNGFGVGRTLRWQHRGITAGAGELVETILRRQLKERGLPGHNGIGLWWLHDIACVSGGEIEIITEDDLDGSGGTAFGIRLNYPGTGSPAPAEQRIYEGVRLRGTLITASLRVPSFTGEEWHRPLADREAAPV